MISSNNTDLIWRSLNWQIYPLLKMGSCRYMKYQDVNILHTNTWGNSKFLSLSINCTLCYYQGKCLYLYRNHETLIFTLPHNLIFLKHKLHVWCTVIVHCILVSLLTSFPFIYQAQVFYWQRTLYMFIKLLIICTTTYTKIKRKNNIESGYMLRVLWFSVWFTCLVRALTVKVRFECSLKI